eukprot:INCI15984.1.p1 GENE.INCI15984.1~~INCI15984.1.p1  ORF type:complete len:1608 (+),score=300.32 INCI15984.1:191-5014(+)
MYRRLHARLDSAVEDIDRVLSKSRDAKAKLRESLPSVGEHSSSGTARSAQSSSNAKSNLSSKSPRKKQTIVHWLTGISVGEDRSHAAAPRGDRHGSSESDSDQSGDLFLDEDDDDSSVFEESKLVERSSQVKKANKNKSDSSKDKAKIKQKRRRMKRLAKNAMNDDFADVDSVSADTTVTLKLLAQSRDLLLETHSIKKHGGKKMKGKSTAEKATRLSGRTTSRRDHMPRSSGSFSTDGSAMFQSKLLLKNWTFLHKDSGEGKTHADSNHDKQAHPQASQLVRDSKKLDSVPTRKVTNSRQRKRQKKRAKGSRRGTKPPPPARGTDLEMQSRSNKSRETGRQQRLAGKHHSDSQGSSHDLDSNNRSHNRAKNTVQETGTRSVPAHHDNDASKTTTAQSESNDQSKDAHLIDFVNKSGLVVSPLYYLVPAYRKAFEQVFAQDQCYAFPVWRKTEGDVSQSTANLVRVLDAIVLECLLNAGQNAEAEVAGISSSKITSKKAMLAKHRVVKLLDDITSHKVCVTRHRATSGGLVAPSSVNLPQLLEILLQYDISHIHIGQAVGLLADLPADEAIRCLLCAVTNTRWCREPTYRHVVVPALTGEVHRKTNPLSSNSSTSPLPKRQGGLSSRASSPKNRRRGARSDVPAAAGDRVHKFLADNNLMGLEALLRVMAEGRRFRGRKASTAEEMFKAIDVDGGGTICEAEFLATMQRLGFYKQNGASTAGGIRGKGTQSVAFQRLWSYLDIRREGEISLDDFKSVMHMIKQLFEEERDVGNPALQDGIPRESDSMKQKGGEAGFSPLQEKGQKTAQTQRRTLVRRPVLSKSHQNILERAKDADRIMTEKREEAKAKSAAKARRMEDRKRRQRFMVGKLGAAVSPLLQLRKLMRTVPPRKLYGVSLDDEEAFFSAVNPDHHGQLSFQEIAEALKRLGVIVSAPEAVNKDEAIAVTSSPTSPTMSGASPEHMNVVVNSNTGGEDHDNDAGSFSRVLDAAEFEEHAEQLRAAALTKYRNSLLTAPSLIRILDKGCHGVVTLQDFKDVLRAESTAPWLKAREQTFQSVLNNAFHPNVAAFRIATDRYDFSINEPWIYIMNNPCLGKTLLDVAVERASEATEQEKSITQRLVEAYNAKDRLSQQRAAHQEAKSSASSQFDSIVQEVVSWLTIDEAFAAFAEPGVSKNMTAQRVLHELVKKFNDRLVGNTDHVASTGEVLYVHDSVRKAEPRFAPSLLEEGLVVYHNDRGYGRIKSINGSNDSYVPVQGAHGSTTLRRSSSYAGREATATRVGSKSNLFSRQQPLDAPTCWFRVEYATDGVNEEEPSSKTEFRTHHEYDAAADMPDFIIQGRCTRALIGLLVELHETVQREALEMEACSRELAAAVQAHAQAKTDLAFLKQHQTKRRKIIADLKSLGGLRSEDVPSASSSRRRINKQKADADAASVSPRRFGNAARKLKMHKAAWGSARAAHQSVADASNEGADAEDADSGQEYKAMLTQLGHLDLGGLMPLVDALDGKRSLFGVALSSVDEMFSAIDKDGDNEVSLDEFSRGCGRLGLGLSETQLQQLFSFMDADGGGKIDIDEFKLAILCARTMKSQRSVPDSVVKQVIFAIFVTFRDT